MARRVDPNALSTLRQRFASYLAGECNLAPLTVYGYERSLARLERHCGKPIEEITASEIRAFLRETDRDYAQRNATELAELLHGGT